MSSEVKAPACMRCKNSMVWSDYSEGMYKEGWHCDNFDTCRQQKTTPGQGKDRWFCQSCGTDICSVCAPAPVCAPATVCDTGENKVAVLPSMMTWIHRRPSSENQRSVACAPATVCTADQKGALPSIMTWIHRRPRCENQQSVACAKLQPMDFTWRVTNAVHASGHSIRDRPNAFASAIGTKRRGDVVYGVLENAEWLKLSREAGYCRIKREDGTALLEEVGKDAAEDMNSTIPVPKKTGTTDPHAMSFKDKKALFERQSSAKMADESIGA